MGQKATLSESEQLEAIKTRVGEIVAKCLQTLSVEACTISSDLVALQLRLEAAGSAAEIDDIRSARWFRAKDQLSVAREIYCFICRTTTGSDSLSIPLVDTDESGESLFDKNSD